MTKKTHIVLSVVLIVFILQSSFFNIVSALSSTPKQSDEDRVKQLKETLLASPNYLQYAEYKMLKHKVSPLGAQPKRLSCQGTSYISDSWGCYEACESAGYDTGSVVYNEAGSSASCKNAVQVTCYGVKWNKITNCGGPGSYKINYCECKYYDYQEYRLQPRYASPLSKEYKGETNRIDSNYYLFSSSVDLLTGVKAIDESMQLGSIGTERNTINSDKSRIESALSRYYTTNNVYPLSLNQLVPKYLSTVPAGFSYKRLVNAYELKAIGSPASIDISSIESLSLKSHQWLKSHDWGEMMTGEKPQIPDIFSVIPADYFTVYFKDVDKLTELEKAIKSMSGPAEYVYGMKGATNVKDQIFKRLQIKEIKELSSFFEEAALVSYDLDFTPHTDYALILNVKDDQLNNFISNYVSAPAGQHGKVGQYYVVATHPSMYEKISGLTGNKSDSLKVAPDVEYILSIMESNYDGFVYFSEDFIKKITSPSYRINARRRNTILSALETLQYTVFAYRNLTGKWPGSLQQIINEGYLQPNSIASINDYSINSDGIVKHKDWNTVYDVTPINRVPISKVFLTEKTFYDNFRENYQEYWREFIDPVGIAVLVGDQIRFHTIIIPLIEESQYNWLKDIAGSEPIEFGFVQNPDRFPSIQFLLKLNLDDSLYAIYKAEPYSMDQEYQKCLDDYYEKSYSERQGKMSSDFCPEPKEKTKEEAVKLLKDQLAKGLNWKEEEDVLGFIGNEFTFAVGDDLSIGENDFSDLDIYLGLELTNTDLAKKFLEYVFEWYEKQMSSYDDYNSMDYYGLIQTNKPIKNEYNGVEFYIIPTGFTNIYYTFVNNRFYIALSQKTINKLIDGVKNEGPQSSQMVRLMDYIGKVHNALFTIDGSKLETWAKKAVKKNWLSSGGTEELNQDVTYYTEALGLAKNLPGYDGTISNVAQKYFTHAPTQWFDAKLTSHDGNLYLSIGEDEYNVNDIDLISSSYYYNEDTEEKAIKLEDITDKFNTDAAFEKWEAAKSFGVGLKFTKEGLDIAIAFNNPESKGLDSRIPSNKIKEILEKKDTYIIGIIAGIIILIILITLIVRLRKKKGSGNIYSSSQAPMGPSSISQGGNYPPPGPPINQ